MLSAVNHTQFAFQYKVKYIIYKDKNNNNIIIINKFYSREIERERERNPPVTFTGN
jgi:hypothetical protein